MWLHVMLTFVLCPVQLKFGRPSSVLGSSAVYPNTDSSIWNGFSIGGDALEPSEAVFLHLQFAVGEERAA